MKGSKCQKRSCLGLGKDSIFFQETTCSLENIKRKYFDFLRTFCSEIKRNDKMVTKNVEDPLSPNIFRCGIWQKTCHMKEVCQASMLWLRLPAHAEQEWHFALQDLDRCAARQTDHEEIKSLTSHSHCCAGVVWLLHVDILWSRWYFRVDLPALCSQLALHDLSML